MTFILNQTDDPYEQNRRFAAYQQYLQANKDRFPPSAFAFAIAPWHYDISDSRCPHDSWVEELIISEPARGERSENRWLEISVRLLGAYHNGHLELRYVDVKSYHLDVPAETVRPFIGHGDWLLDEVRLSESSLVLHEIRFERGHWQIECTDIKASWHPM